MVQTKPILYSFRRCPYAMRARMALMVSGQAVELREVVLRNKPQAMLDASPKATVPVLILADGDVIEESLDIMRWALPLNDPDGWLTPSHGTLKEMLALIEHFDGPFKDHLDQYKYETRYDDIDPAEHRLGALKELELLAARLQSHSFLFGDHLTLADAAIFPFVRQLANVNRDDFNGAAPEQVVAWLDRCLDLDLFASVMTKYSPWIPGEIGEIFP